MKEISQDDLIFSILLLSKRQYFPEMIDPAYAYQADIYARQADNGADLHYYAARYVFDTRTFFFINLLHSVRHATSNVPALSLFFFFSPVPFLSITPISHRSSRPHPNGPLTIHVCVYYVRGESCHARARKAQRDAC